MRKPYLSIIVPYHNSVHTIVPLLSSLARSIDPPPYELLLIDDYSALPLVVRSASMRVPAIVRDRVGKITGKSGRTLQLKSPRGVSIPFSKACVDVRVVQLNANRGPAIARNVGAQLARGEFLLFLDGDVQVFSDTLANLTTLYHDDPDIVAITGVWVKEQKTTAFFPNFKALRDWSYWINERDTSGYYFLFSTRIASIKKSVFDRLGGFNESYNAALVEDIELTYRIARRYAIIFAPNVRVHHEFEGFWPIAKKYFLRAYHWTKLYNERKKFDPVATTWVEALTTISGVLFVGFLVACIVSLPSLPLLLYVTPVIPQSLLWLSLVFYVCAAVFGLLHILFIRRFLWYMTKERGVIFAIKGFFVGLVLYCFIFAGALWGRVRR